MLRLLCCLTLLTALPALHCAEGETPTKETPKATSVEAVHLGIIPDTDTAVFDNTRGVLVKEVEPGNFAAAIGILPKDIITHFNSQPILRVEDLKRALAASRIGNKATITIKRKDKMLDLKGTLRGKFRSGDIGKKRKELEALTKAAGAARKARSGDLAQNLRYLAVALNELPDRIEDAAHEFKKVYPKGEFTINIEIRISTNKNKEPATNILLGEDADIPDELKDVPPSADEKKMVNAHSDEQQAKPAIGEATTITKPEENPEEKQKDTKPESGVEVEKPLP